MTSRVEQRIAGLAIRILAMWMLAAPLGPARASAQNELAGTWRGDLTTPAGALTLVISLDGESGGTISVPSGGVADIPVTDVQLAQDGSVTFKVPADSAAFEGRIEADTRLVGEWVQAGQRVPIEFERVVDTESVPTVSKRRQTPEPPFPYAVEEVIVTTGEQLACTLTRPRASDRRVTGVVLLTVAGPNDRDQTHSGHKPYMVLADHLTRSGVAVLRCDDRGVGGSSGELLASSVDDLVADALAMVGYLASREGVGSVGVIGNSEGSVVGSLAAVREPQEVAFVVLLGGVGVRGAAVVRERLVAQSKAAGRSVQETESLVAPFDSLTRVVTEAGGVGAAELERTRPELHAELQRIARTAGQEDPFLPADVDERVALFAGPWYYAQATLDGGSILAQVQVPVLALTGSKDRTNLPGQNLPAIRAALERGGNPDFQVTEVPDLNHVFQTAVVGGLAEYGRLEESFSPFALEMITGWIVQRFTKGT